MLLSSYALAQTCTGPLSGTYTLGTPTSDYPTFGDALLDLQACGVSGAVTFNVAPGTYTGHIGIDPVAGASATNTITFDGGSAAGTILTHDASGPNQGATVLFDEADHITFRNFTIASTGGGSSSFGVQFYDDADFNTVDNCIVTCAATTFNTSAILFGGSYTSNFTEGESDNCTVSNCTLIGGNRAITMEGDGFPFSVGNQILNNTMQGMQTYGIYMDNQEGIVMFGNTIGLTNSTFGDGIYCFDLRDFTIAANDIQAQDWGIYVSDGNFDGTPTQRGLVVNNMVRSLTDYGMYLLDFEESDIWNNTIIGEPALYIDDFPGVDIRNNILVSDDDFAFEAIDATAFLAFDYNIFYRAQPGDLIRYSSFHPDLADFQAANPTFNANSIENEPGFTSLTDLHSEGTVANDVGDPSLIGVVSIDIDGDVRPAAGATNMDIGADEYTPPANDAGVSARITPINPTATGFSPIELTVENFGLNTLNSFEIGWSINGTPQTTVSYNIAANPLAPSTSGNYVLGNYNWPNNFTNVRTWTQNPNGATDERFENDTLDFLICPGLAGTYTVGTPTSDFPTLEDAAFALTSCGVSGAVVFELQPGTYNGPLTLPAVTGMSATNTVAFDGLAPADVTLTHDGSGGFGQNVTIAIDGGDHYIIRNMTIEMTSTANAWAVFLTNGANENRIENNIINLPVSGGTTSQGIVASDDYNNDFGEGNNANGNVILNNTITGGEMGIHLEGSFAQKNGRNFILNNTIQDVDDYGIYVDEQDTLRINGNSVTRVNNTFADGIYASDIMNFQVIGNYAVAPDYGLYIFDGNVDLPPTTTAVIVNNMLISDGDAAMYLFDVAQTNVFHNSFYGQPGLLLNDALLDFRNNLCLGDGDYAIESVDPFFFTTGDNNLYHRFGAGDVLFFDIPYADLATWQAAPANVNGFDAASVQGDPGIVSPTDLHLTGVPANDAGDNTVFILQDIDGDSRPAPGSTVVDIGADEYSVNNDDAVLAELLRPVTGCGVNADSVFVVVLNQGLDTITNVPVTVDVSGAATTTLTTTYAGPLPSGAQDTVFMGTLNTFNGGFFDFTAYTQLATDQDLSNDTLMTTVGISTSGPVVGVADTACLGNSANLGVLASPGLNYNWYSDPAGTNLVGVGNTFQTPALTGPATYYVGPLSGGSVLTTYADNNTSQGMMFDVEGTSNLTISAFDLHINPTPGSAVTVDVYYISNNTYLGNNNAAGLWTLEGSYTVTSAGINNPTNLVLTNGGIPVVPGQTTAVFIDLPGSPGDMENTNGTTSYTDGTLTVFSGGETNGTFTGSFFNGRVFNGEVYYSIPPCNSTIVPVTASVNTVAPTVNLNGTTQVVCSDDMPTLDAGNAGATFAWSTGATTREITAMAPGTYTVTVTSAGCSAVDSAIVDYFPVPTITPALTDVSCNSSSDGAIDLTLLGGGTPYTFNWSNGATTEDISGLAAGAYTGTVTDGNGCAYVASATINEPAAVSLMLDALDSVSCNAGQDGSITVSAMGGTAPYSFDWSTGATGNNVSGLSAGAYDVTGTDGNGCTDVQSYTVAEANPLNVSVNVTDETNAYQASANISVTGGTAPYFFNWSSGQVTPQVNDLVAGTYQVVVSDVNGCQETITVIVDFFVPTDEIEGLETLSLFPNPTKDQLTLSFDLTEVKDVQLSIFDALGQEVQTYTSELTDGEQYEVDLSGYAPGVYFARLTVDGQVISRRIVLQK